VRETSLSASVSPISSTQRPLKRMDIVLSAGKSRKNVDAYVLLPLNAKKAANLIETRSQVGVQETN